MIATPLFIDVGHAARRKWNQNVCGDAFESRRFENGERLIAVLSDGLGSGVKANILSTMTANMALRFVAAGSDFLRSSEVMMEALPVCQVRKIAYATFTIVDCDREGGVRIVEEGNPAFVLMRGCRVETVVAKQLASKRFPERRMRVAEAALRPGDRLVICSDGVTQAGMGTRRYPLGWREGGLRGFLATELRRRPDVSSRELAARVADAAIGLEPEEKPLDDTSCLVLYFREPRRLLVMSGPPYDESRDAEYAARFDDFPGRKAICGGTTANLVARELGCRLELEMDPSGRLSGLPPCSRMPGVELVTEGILTLTQVAKRLEHPAAANKNDAADRVIELLLDSDAIEFMVGTRINDAHQDPTLPSDLDIRRNVLKRIAELLRTRHLKEVSLSFI